jgi:hypothetical protein
MENFGLYLIAFGLISAILVAKIVLDSRRRRGVMGINLRSMSCPTCATEIPTVRRPTSLRQALFGGSTCKSCGTELDKWGRIRLQRATT